MGKDMFIDRTLSASTQTPETGMGAASNDKPGPLPVFGACIGCARKCGYEAETLACSWGIGFQQLDNYCQAFCLRSTQDCLDEIRLCDAAGLVCGGRSPHQIAFELNFLDELAFCLAFERYHRSTPAEFRENYQLSFRENRQWLQELSGNDELPEELLELPWVLALRTLNRQPGRFLPENDRSAPPRALLLQRLHEKILGGDQQAKALFAQFELGRLEQALVRRFPPIDPQMIADAATEAIRDYLAHPEKYRPNSNMPLETWLEWKSRRNLFNLGRSQKRRPDRDPLPDEDSTEVLPAGCMNPITPYDLLVAEETESEEGKIWIDRKAWWAEFVRQSTRKDQLILALMLDGERNFGPYAEILGITMDARAEQQKQVKQNKYRLSRALKEWTKWIKKVEDQARHKS